MITLGMLDHTHHNVVFVDLWRKHIQGGLKSLRLQNFIEIQSFVHLVSPFS